MDDHKSKGDSPSAPGTTSPSSATASPKTGTGGGFDATRQPIHVGKSGQQIYRFANGLAASVIKDNEVAVINLHDGKTPEGGLHINYFTPFGMPHRVENVPSALDQIAGFTADELTEYRKRLAEDDEHHA